jgi:hypothetical protein
MDLHSQMVTGSVRMLWVEGMSLVLVILESYVQGVPRQQKFAEQLAKHRAFKEHQEGCCAFTQESDLNLECT